VKGGLATRPGDRAGQDAIFVTTMLSAPTMLSVPTLLSVAALLT